MNGKGEVRNSRRKSWACRGRRVVGPVGRPPTRRCGRSCCTRVSRIIARFRRTLTLSSLQGRPAILSSAGVTILTKVARTICQKIPAGAATMKCIFAEALKEQGLNWHSSVYKKPAGSLAEHMGEGERADHQANLSEKVAFIMKENNIPASRAHNLDETCLRLLPTHSYGWSMGPEECSHDHIRDADEASATLRPPHAAWQDKQGLSPSWKMALVGFSWTQRVA